MNLRQSLFTELDSYLNGEKYEKPRLIADVTQLIAYKTATEEGKKEIKTILENHRVARGIYRKGFRIFFDPEEMKIKTEDIHIVNVTVKNSRNRPKAIATFNNNIISIVLSNKRFTRTVIKNPDGSIHSIEPIQVEMSALAMEDVFYHANYFVEGESMSKQMDYEMIRFDENSIVEFYSFERSAFIKFTPSVLNKYWERSDMTLKRHTINIDTHSNDWGLIFPYWSDTLVEVEGGAAYIGDDITQEEVDAITADHEYSWITRDIRRKFKAMHNEDEEDKEEKKNKISKILTSLQSVIDENDECIIDETIQKAGISNSAFAEITDKADRMAAKKNALARKEQGYGFDCGFLYFRFIDETLSDLAKEVAAYGLSHVYEDGTFTLEIPYENQSTTLKRYQAQTIKELVNKQKLPEISFKTVLD